MEGDSESTTSTQNSDSDNAPDEPNGLFDKWGIARYERPNQFISVCTAPEILSSMVTYHVCGILSTTAKTCTTSPITKLYYMGDADHPFCVKTFSGSYYLLDTMNDEFTGYWEGYKESLLPISKRIE